MLHFLQLWWRKSQKKMRCAARRRCCCHRPGLSSPTSSAHSARPRATVRVQAQLASAAGQVGNAAAALSRALNSSGSSLSPADLAALESAVQSVDVGSIVTEASAVGGSAGASAAANLAAASAATRDDVVSLSHDVFDQKLFDRYLHFSSAQDEAAFRTHAAEVHKYVDAQLARGTAEGNLNAGGGMVDYMLDAKTHGAGDSPDFMPRWNRLAADTQREHAAMTAAGQSTAEYDRTVTASVRRFLKAKGMTDAEIDKRLVAGADPLDVVKPFLGDDRDSRSLENQMASVAKSGAPSPAPGSVDVQKSPAADAAQLSSSFDAVASKLRSAGLQLSDVAETTPAHGLTQGKAAGKAAQPGGPN